MLNLLAQTYTTYTYPTTTTTSTAGTAALGGFFLVVTLIALVVAVIMIISMWKIFTKAGEDGWKSLIPFYNGWILAELAGKPGWWGLVSLVSIIGFIPVLGWIADIAVIVVYVMIYLSLAKAFNKSTGFGVCMLLFPYVTFPMLAFGSAKYAGPRFHTNTGGAAPTAQPKPPVKAA